MQINNKVLSEDFSKFSNIEISQTNILYGKIYSEHNSTVYGFLSKGIFNVIIYSGIDNQRYFVEKSLTEERYKNIPIIFREIDVNDSAVVKHYDLKLPKLNYVIKKGNNRFKSPQLSTLKTKNLICYLFVEVLIIFKG